MFKVGQEVVCVHPPWKNHGPKNNDLVTINEIIELTGLGPQGLILNGWPQFLAYESKYFREVLTDNDIAELVEKIFEPQSV